MQISSVGSESDRRRVLLSFATGHRFRTAVIRGNDCDLDMPNDSSTRRWQRPEGVTLLELVIVLALISLVVALAAPQFANWIDEWRLRSAAERTAQAIRYARTRAVFEQNYYLVEVNATTERVQVADAAADTVRQFALPSGTRVDDGEEPRPALVRLLIPPSGDLEERNLWLTDRRGRQFRIHVDFLQGNAAVEAVNPAFSGLGARASSPH